MAGINGLAVAFRSAASVRIYKFTVLVKDATDTTQNQQYASLPAAGNAAGVLGVLTEHFVEPNYFVPQATDPTTVTGTTPVLYNLAGRGLTLQVNGIARCIAAGAVNQGDVLVVADKYGRVTNTAGAGVAAGGKLNAVGTAQNSTANANDVVEVLLSFAQMIA
ncbi:MAG: hypothetical protein KGM47_09875 [Acidobacteriota bacterium]|nr:hypothetical protein [Acidobacteriota bacterium]